MIMMMMTLKAAHANVLSSLFQCGLGLLPLVSDCSPN